MIYFILVKSKTKGIRLIGKVLSVIWLPSCYSGHTLFMHFIIWHVFFVWIGNLFDGKFSQQNYAKWLEIGQQNDENWENQIRYFDDIILQVHSFECSNQTVESEATILIYVINTLNAFRRFIEEFSEICDKPLTFHFMGALIGSSITTIMVQIEIVQYISLVV